MQINDASIIRRFLSIMHSFSVTSANIASNPLLPKGGGLQELLRIPKQMENAHFAENRITGVPLGHVWSVMEHK